MTKAGSRFRIIGLAIILVFLIGASFRKYPDETGKTAGLDRGGDSKTLPEWR